MEHALARPFRTASGQLNRRFAAGPFRVMLQKERRRLASFAVTGNVSGVCLPAPASDPLHCTTTPPSERSMLESRHTCMTRFRQLALLVYPRWPSRPPIARFPLSFQWSSPRTSLLNERTISDLDDSCKTATRRCLHLPCSLSKTRVRRKLTRSPPFHPLQVERVE
jgi:hypothetical protein